MKKTRIRIIVLNLIIVLTCLNMPRTDYAVEEKNTIGDINSDGIIDSRDTLKILQHISASTILKIGHKHPGWILNNEKFKAGDINEDGIIDSRDVLKELEYIAASTIPKIGQKNPEWKKYIEAKRTKESNEIRRLVIEKTSLIINKGKTQKITAKITPDNTSNKTIVWSSSDSSVARIDGLGNVTGIKSGLTIITAKTTDGLSKTCKVKVVDNTPKTKTNNKIAVKSISLKSTTQTIKKGSYIQLGITIQPINATDKTITWSSDKPNVATVTTTGKVYAVNAGKATITAKTKNGKTAKCSITVKGNEKTAQKVINIIKEWKKSGGKTAHKEVIKYYNQYAKAHGKSRMNTSLSHDLWCSETASAAYVKAGMADLIGGVASCTSAYKKNFEKKGIKKSKSNTPKPGWIVCYGSGTGHTAVVTRVSGNKIYYLAGGGSGIHEGHTSKSSVKFYGAPNFD